MTKRCNNSPADFVRRRTALEARQGFERACQVRPLRKIGVWPPRAFETHELLFRGVSGVFPIEVVPWNRNCPGTPDALILLGSPSDPSLPRVQCGVPSIAFPEIPNGGVVDRNAPVVFSDSESIDPILKRQRLPEYEVGRVQGLEFLPGDEVVATKAETVIWLKRPQAGETDLDVVGVSLPSFGEGDHLFELLRPRKWLRLLPLLHFLKDVTREGDWQKPPLRACIVFDDPSLWRQSYGCLDFAELVLQARKHSFHAAIALVPLTARWASRATTSLLRSHSAEVSLVIHGNDHTHLEMAQVRKPGEYLQILAQALSRVERLESRHGIQVDRIMEPPYGVLCSEAAQSLSPLGYEAVLMHVGQFLKCNSHKQWPLAFGLGMVELLDEGFMAIPRQIISADWYVEALIAAFLGQPIVVAAHHFDAANDFELIAEIASAINSFGTVRWSSVQGLARSNYKWRINGREMVVQLFGQQADLAVPEGINHIYFALPVYAGTSPTLLTVSSADGKRTCKAANGELLGPIQVSTSGKLNAVIEFAGKINRSQVPQRGLEPWPVARRVLVEVRDRLYPILQAIGSLKTRLTGRPASINEI